MTDHKPHVTPEMLKAGKRALMELDLRFADYDDIALGVYIAMRSWAPPEDHLTYENGP